jgi:hypothetical protein
MACVLGDVAELARHADPLGNLAALVRLQELDLLLQLLVALRREDDFLQGDSGLLNPGKRGAMVAAPSRAPQGRGYHLQAL